MNQSVFPGSCHGFKRCLCSFFPFVSNSPFQAKKAPIKNVCMPYTRKLANKKSTLTGSKFVLFSFVVLLFHPVSAGVFLFHLIVQCFWVTLCVDRKTRSEKPAFCR